jgi:hypothetical protein
MARSTRSFPIQNIGAKYSQAAQKFTKGIKDPQKVLGQAAAKGSTKAAQVIRDFHGGLKNHPIVKGRREREGSGPKRTHDGSKELAQRLGSGLATLKHKAGGLAKLGALKAQYHATSLADRANGKNKLLPSPNNRGPMGKGMIMTKDGPQPNGKGPLFASTREKRGPPQPSKVGRFPKGTQLGEVPTPR